ncbi:MAG: endonuclease domain-containing protein, partial [Candidatus Dormibacteraceae bacterium]
LCKPCNRDVLGHLRDDPAALQRAIDYLTNPPARAVLGETRTAA